MYIDNKIFENISFLFSFIWWEEAGRAWSEYQINHKWRGLTCQVHQHQAIGQLLLLSDPQNKKSNVHKYPELKFKG